ncbi:permease prefix domain 1-containing protein [Dactylosporangium sp. NPDC048998]|uniref:permease prefix domain 1-containing protein n=1 Tax=Dactylosporangium sp. NPDC048998 TaxID=3363976 RepID=UPI003715B361
MDPSVSDRIDSYLDAVTVVLPAGRRARAAIRAELADGLACAVEARVGRGAAPGAAAAAALAEFGPPAVVARAFARELLAASTHRTGRGLLLGGPLVGLLWVLAMPGAGRSWPVGPSTPTISQRRTPRSMRACAACLSG